MQDRSRQYAAAAFAFTLLLTLFTKVVRAALLASSTHGTRPWVVFPLVLGLDLVFVAGSALLAAALARVPIVALRVGLAVLLLVLLVPVHVFDIGAQELVGAPLTFQRLRGDEGGHITDLGLVGARELWLGITTIVVWLGLIWPIVRFAPRYLADARVLAPRVLAALVAVGLGGHFAQDRLLRQTVGLETQSAVTLLASFWDEEGFEGRALSKAEWARLLAPATKPMKRETPPPKLPSERPKNLVVFLAEGIAFEHTGFSRQHSRNPTPRLSARVKREGFLFSRYYTHWHASNQAIFSVACAMLPPLGGDMMGLKPRIDCGELSETMRASGRRAGLFHAGHFSFYNKLALLGRRGYETELDAEDIMLRSKKWQRMRWGTDDRAMVEAATQWAERQKAEPFAALLISVAPHYPFELPRSFRERPFKGPGELPRYLNGVNFIDAVFEEMIRSFEVRGLADDTLFVFLGDHGIQVAEPSRVTPGRRSFYEPSLHVPLVLINKKLFPPTLRGRTSDRVAGHMDLLPTLLDVLGEPADRRHHGQSLFRSQGWPRRMFFAANAGKYIGFIDHDHKFVYSPRGKRTEYYDLASDPEERSDLSEQNPELMVRFSEEAQTIAQGLRAEVDAAPVLDEEITMAQVYTLFRTHVQVSIERAGVRSECPKDESGMGRVCPDVGPVLTQKDQDIQGEKRRCLRVRVPEGATVRLRVTDATTLSLLTATSGMVARRDPPATRFEITSDVDGLKKFETAVRNVGAQYVDHARARKSLEYAISRTHAGKPDEICLQLTKAKGEAP